MSKQIETLILSGQGYSLAVTTEAQKRKVELLEAARSITAVSDHSGSETARAQAAEIAAVRIAVEKTLTEIKKPVLEVGRTIDATAAEYMAELKAEEDRLKKLIADHAAEVERQRQEAIRQQREAEREALRKQLEEEAKLRAEEEKARAEAAEAERRRREAEAAQFEAESAQALKAAKDAAEQAAKEQAEAQRKQAEAAAAREALEAKQPEIDEFEAAMLAPPPPKVAGVSFNLDYEITDIRALYHAAPTLCIVTPCRSVLLAALKEQERNGQTPGFPGITVIKKPKVSTR